MLIKYLSHFGKNILSYCINFDTAGIENELDSLKGTIELLNEIWGKFSGETEEK